MSQPLVATSFLCFYDNMVIILFQEHNTDTLYIELGLKSDSHSWFIIRYIELLLLISDRIDVRID